MRTDQLCREYNVRVRYCFFPLHPETSAEGLTLEKLFAGRNIDVAKSQKEMAQRMADVGLAYEHRTMTYNSRLAQELAKWAQSQPDGDGFMLEMYKAYFVDKHNIADVDVLKQVAEKAGLSPAEAEEVLSSRRFRDAVDEDWARCRQIGLTSVPAFVAGKRIVMGAQPYEVLEELVVLAGAKKREGVE